MKSSISSHSLVLAIVAVAAFASVVTLSKYVERNRISVPESYSDEDLDLQGKKLKGFGLGFEGLIADWYWMRSLQYIGNKIEKSDTETINLDNLRTLNPRLLYPLLENATELDPKFITAYSYGAVLLPAIDPDEAIKLTEKGIANNPDEWRLYQYLGYIYWRLKNYGKAAEIYERGSRSPGAPPFLKLMVGMMETRGGSRETARQIYAQMHDNADDDDTRRIAGIRLQWLDSLEERDYLNSSLSSFKEKSGQCAHSFGELFPLLKSMTPAGVDLRLNRSGEIIDPTGVPYLLDQSKCEATLSPDSQIPRD
jgi:tetratricopeptide (TPR) repeat protein